MYCIQHIVFVSFSLFHYSLIHNLCVSFSLSHLLAQIIVHSVFAIRMTLMRIHNNQNIICHTRSYSLFRMKWKQKRKFNNNKNKNKIKNNNEIRIHEQTCTVFPLALAGGLHAGISGLADPLLKGTHLSAAMPSHHLQQIPDVS